MARPIEPTPAVEGTDARALLDALERGASEAEMARRTEQAQRFMAEVEHGKTVALRPRGR